jgi:hypothetical protein
VPKQTPTLRSSITSLSADAVLCERSDDIQTLSGRFAVSCMKTGVPNVKQSR